MITHFATITGTIIQDGYGFSLRYDKKMCEYREEINWEFVRENLFYDLSDGHYAFILQITFEAEYDDEGMCAGGTYDYALSLTPLMILQ